MKVKTMIIITIIILPILIISVSSTVYLIVTSFWGKKVNSNSIIKQFKNNEALFEEAVEELSSKEYIYIDKDGGIISISIHENIGDEVNIIRVKQEDFNRYERTLEIMKRFNVNHICKELENTSFLFNSMFGLGQYIVKINNEAEYKRSYHVTDIKEIRNDWYYTETK